MAILPFKPALLPVFTSQSWMLKSSWMDHSSTSFGGQNLLGFCPDKRLETKNLSSRSSNNFGLPTKNLYIYITGLMCAPQMSSAVNFSMFIFLSSPLSVSSKYNNLCYRPSFDLFQLVPYYVSLAYIVLTNQRVE